jgi:hypothetical protein
MRKLFTFLAAIILTTIVLAQNVPQKMSYQAVIRNSNDQLVTNTQIGIEINIRQGSATGTVVYTETQTPSTNSNGLVSLEIGGGAGFNSINWSNDNYFIETKTAIAAPLTTYTITGTTQLLSVPYALYAKTAESISGTIAETDPVYTGSQAANITANDITKLGTLSGTNTGDQDLSGLATITALTTGLDAKVDTVTGKGLSTEDYTTAEKIKVSNLSGTNTGDQDLSGLATTIALTTGLASKVDKVTGKDLSPNGTTSGDMQYWNGTTWLMLPIGTTGQLLAVNTTGLPEWQNPSSLKSASTNAPTMNAIGVSFNGVVNANGLQTTVAFEYGTSTSYGTIANATPSPINGATNTSVVSAVITNLTVGTTYHERIITQNIFGTFYGNDITFTYLYYGISYAGGLVFSVYDNGQHGLVCIPTNIVLSATWANAITACSACTIGGFHDWYLPSKDVLNLMYLNLKMQGLGGFTSPNYWSSTVYDSPFYINYVWGQSFVNGSQGPFGMFDSYNYRPVRAF